MLCLWFHIGDFLDLGLWFSNLVVRDFFSII